MLITTHRIKHQLDNVSIDTLKHKELQLFMDPLQVGFGQLHNDLQMNYFSGVFQAQSQGAG